LSCPSVRASGIAFLLPLSSPPLTEHGSGNINAR
jgi:hypothetical protein